jgi:hypothetical protein
MTRMVSGAHADDRAATIQAPEKQSISQSEMLLAVRWRQG